MNKAKRIVFTCLMTVLIVGSIYGWGIILCPQGIETDFSNVYTFHDMPEQSIEVIAYGSSRAWRSIDSMEMYENYGIGIYNYSASWQAINTTYLFFTDSLQTQSPKVAIFEVRNVSEVLEDVDMNGQIYVTTALESSGYKAEYLQQCFNGELERYLSCYLPILVFHSNWSNLTIQNFIRNSNDTNFYESMGFQGDDTVKSIEPVDTSTFIQYELDDTSLEILDDIVSICDDENIEIIFYIAPFSGEYNYDDAMSQYAEDNDCAYINFFDYMEELDIDWETDFIDINHLNTNGAQKLSDYLAQYIVDNYDVTDMRTVENNLWETYSVE